MGGDNARSHCRNRGNTACCDWPRGSGRARSNHALEVAPGAVAGPTKTAAVGNSCTQPEGSCVEHNKLTLIGAQLKSAASPRPSKEHSPAASHLTHPHTAHAHHSGRHVGNNRQVYGLLSRSACCPFPSEGSARCHRLPVRLHNGFGPDITSQPYGGSLWQAPWWLKWMGIHLLMGHS